MFFSSNSCQRTRNIYDHYTGNITKEISFLKIEIELSDVCFYRRFNDGSTYVQDMICSEQTADKSYKVADGLKTTVYDSTQAQQRLKAGTHGQGDGKVGYKSVYADMIVKEHLVRPSIKTKMPYRNDCHTVSLEGDLLTHIRTHFSLLRRRCYYFKVTLAVNNLNNVHPPKAVESVIDELLSG